MTRFSYTDIEIGLAPSGVFMSPNNVFLSNPYQPDGNGPLENALVSLANSPEADSAHVIQDGALSRYAEQLVRVGLVLSSDPPDLLLVPCRGALKPWQQLRAMTLDKLTAHKFYATGLGDASNIQWITQALRPTLQRAKPERAPFHIAVVDTAIGGHGSFNLAQAIKYLWKEASSPAWRVTFHLLAPEGSGIAGRHLQMSSLTEERFLCVCTVYAVDDLLVEDWDPGFGLRANRDGGEKISLKLMPHHKIGLRMGTEVSIITSTEPWNEINTIIAKYVTEAMLTDPTLQQIDDLTSGLHTER